MKKLTGDLLLLKPRIRIMLFALSISLQGCYQSEEPVKPGSTGSVQSEIQSPSAEESETTAESTRVLQTGFTEEENLPNLLSREYEDTTFLPLSLKTFANEFLSCGREPLISPSAAESLQKFLTFNTRSDFELYRQALESSGDLDSDTKAVLVLLITRGVKNRTLPDTSYTSDREIAYSLLNEISEQTLFSNLVLALSYFEEYGPFNTTDEELAGLLYESLLIARGLESGLSESDRFTSLMIEGMRLIGREDRLQPWLQGELLCDDSAYFTSASLFTDASEYLRYRTNEYANERIDRLIDKGLPLYYYKTILYDELVELNDAGTGLKDPSNVSQGELVMLAQQNYLKGVESGVRMSFRDTWCRADNGLECSPSPPYDSEYLDALLRSSEQTGDSMAHFELAQHFLAINDIERSLFHKYSEYYLDRAYAYEFTAGQIMEMGELMLSSYGVASIPLTLSIIEEYKSDYLPTLGRFGEDLEIEISTYEASLKLLSSLSEPKGNNGEL